MTNEETRAFLQGQIDSLEPIIQKLRMTQRGVLAGGDRFKEKLDEVTLELGANLAVQEDFKAQLNELQPTE